MNYLRWEQVWLPRQCWLDRIDIFHSPVHFGLPWFTKAKCVLTLHDAIDELYGEYRQQKLSFSQRRSRGLCSMARLRANHVITVSEHSRKDLARLYQLPIERISVTYGAADARFDREIAKHEIERIRGKYKLPDRYLFYVGSLERRKNLSFLLRAFAAADLSQLHLVIGGGGARETALLFAEAVALGLGPQVRMLGRVDDSDLPALYEQAEAFVYPSEYEGFGLQLCEAMAVGCPVLASDASGLPEVLGDGGALFSLASVDELTALIRRIHLDSRYRDELHHKALARSARFSWKHTATETVSVYHSLLAA